MASLWFDGCGEFYNTNAQAQRVWTNIPNMTVQSTTPRTAGGKYIRGTAGTHWARKAFINGSTDECVWGFAYRTSTIGGTSVFARMWGSGTEHLRFSNVSGQILVELGNGTDIVTSAATPLSANTWHYIEIRALIANSGGQVEVHVDGVQVINESSVDTQNGGTATVNMVQVSSHSGVTTEFDDVYICDMTGAAPHNTFLGDVRVDVILPDGAGNTSDFDTTNGSANHWENVDEANADDDTTYNETPTANDVDLFTYEALDSISGGSSELGVKAVAIAKKVAAGDADLRLVARPGVTNRNGSTLPSQTSYKAHEHVWPTNPDGGAWTKTAIDGSEFGVEKL